MSRFLVLCVVLVPACVVLGGQAAPPPRLITIDDYFQIHSVRDPQLSPDGLYVTYTVEAALLKEDKNEDRIWMVPTAGGEALALTAGGHSSNHARWSPDGKAIAFLSERGEGKTQVWLLPRHGGEAERLTDTAQDVEDFAWAPDSRRLVLVLRDPSSEELEAAKEKKERPAAAKEKTKTQKPWVIDRLQFKMDEIGYLDRRRTHLYTFDLAAKSLKQVTSGDYDDSEPAWSPDGKLLAFSSNRSQPDPDATYDINIWVVAADNTDKGARLTQVTTNPGADTTPAWSPDGKWITYVTQLDPKLFDYATKHIAVSPASGGEAKVLTQALDRMSSDPHFTPDGKHIFFICDDDGTQNVCSVSFGDGTVGARPVPGRLMVNAYSIGGGAAGNIVAQVATLDRPDELFSVKNGKLTQITHTNDLLMSQLKLTHGEYVHFKSKDGTTVSGYLYKPVDYVPGKKYPTILRPHGGPVWAYYAEFDHLPQLYAANGYVVLFPNPRGSTGYGQKYDQAIWADWGNKDFQDDMAMVDYAIEQGIADPEKLGVGGWSYGGISTDFIIAQTNRFKAAISGAGAAFFTSLYGHDHYQRDYEAELGQPWQNKAVWEKVSPFYRVGNIKTPTLFMGGEIDWNVPILGGEQMYQALKRLGRTTELVVYPGEYHEFKTPSHIKDRLERYLAWYNHYVKGDSAPPRPVEQPAALPKSPTE
ncbi:MAG TPA: S9 family peptidase [Candidatus Angelobacter sp.]|nr:S9 family peptidase [Candidatus Angelobacter sp.]